MVAAEPFVVWIPRTIYDEMVTHIAEGYPYEACGALGSNEGLAVEQNPTANAAEHPDAFSLLAPDDLHAIYDAIEEYNGDMIYYHSHPKSEAYPSRRDNVYDRLTKIP
jgi:[CysO sulfur-carrier protein]-S-L-cysteine hydrolase